MYLLVVVFLVSTNAETIIEPRADICDIPGICSVNERCVVNGGEVNCIPLSFCDTDSCGEGFICNEDYEQKTFNCSCMPGRALVGDRCVPFCELDVCLEGMVCVPYDNSFDCICPEKYIMSKEGECVPLCQTSPCPDNMNCLLQRNNTFSCLCHEGHLLANKAVGLVQSMTKCESFCTAASCPADMTCVEHTDSFSCLCPEGTSMSRNELCVPDCQITGCLAELDCRQRGTKYGCFCPVGQLLHNNICTPMCATKPCPDNMDCLLHNDTYSCVCHDGELIDPVSGECREICGLKPCPPNMDCLVHNETYSCVCRDGEMLSDKGDCVPYCDTNPCPPNLLCVPHPTSYSCLCPENGVLIHDQCTALCDLRACNGTCSAGRGEAGHVWYSCTCQECGCESNPCSDNEVCIEDKDSYICSCDVGYVLVEGRCQDVDECQNNICKGGMQCTNSPGSYSCSCPPGTLWDLTKCVDVNECLMGPCPEGMECVDLKKSFACQCQQGYEMIGEECVDLNECILFDGCLPGMICENIPGSFRCSCPEGYFANQLGECQDVDECKMKKVCNKGDVCTNTLGSFRCDCSEDNCDKDVSCECDIQTEYCRDGVCRCKYGYKLKHGQCVSRCGHGLCGGHNTVCDVTSSEVCSCKPGFETYTSPHVAPCIDINECVTLKPCGRNEECRNTRGAFKCLCKAGHLLLDDKCVESAKIHYATITPITNNLFTIGETAKIVTRIRTARNISPVWTLVSWSKGLVSLSPPPLRYETPYNRQVLAIKNFLPEDAGNYTVMVEKKGFLTASLVISVNVKPLMIKLTKGVLFGNWVKMEVSVAFKGTYKLKWYRISGSHKQLLVPGPDIRFSRKGQTVQIRNYQSGVFESRVVGFVGERQFSGTEQFLL